MRQSMTVSNKGSSVRASNFSIAWASLIFLALGVCMFGLQDKDLPSTSSISSCRKMGAISKFFPPEENLDVMDPDDASIAAEHYTKLVEKYAPELRTEFELADQFKVDSTSILGQNCRGEIGRIEASMLYIMLREENPKYVMEVGALCGSSTRWILAALEANGSGGKLITFDLHAFPRKTIPASSNWQFLQKDAFAYFETEPGRQVLEELDFYFIDALHKNSFSRYYTQSLFANTRKRMPVFCHDIFNPFLLPPFRACGNGLTFESWGGELECIKQVAEKQLKQMKNIDIFYGPHQSGGEGPELLSWLARTGRSSQLVTFSGFAAPVLAEAMMQAFTENGLELPRNNNWGVFFELRPKAGVLPTRIS